MSEQYVMLTKNCLSVIGLATALGIIAKECRKSYRKYSNSKKTQDLSIGVGTMIGVSMMGLIAGVDNIGAGLGALVGALVGRTYLETLEDIKDE